MVKVKYFKNLLLNLCLLLFMTCNLITPSLDDDCKFSSIKIYINSLESRLISPDMEIEYFEVSGIGPSSEVFGPEVFNSDTFSKSGLSLGEWTLSVKGKNLNGIVIAESSGSDTVILESGQDAYVTIPIHPLSGYGTFSLNITFPEESLISPVIDAKFGTTEGSQDMIPTALSGNSFTTLETSYPVGYYTLTFGVFDGTSPRTAHTEIVRIAHGQNTHAAFSLTAEELEIGGVAPVFFSIDEGEYSSMQTVALSSFTDNSIIKYTTNGSTPTENTGVVYSDPIIVNCSQTIKAMAFSAGYNNSYITSAEYIIIGTIPLPKVSLDEGEYYVEQILDFSVPGGDYTVVYTTNEEEPSLSPLNGFIYTTPITLETETLYNFKARTFNTGNPQEFSDLITAIYNITGTVSNPVFSITEGNYYENQTLEIYTDTPDVNIYYTTDGTTPSINNGIIYSEAITIDSSQTIKAIAVKTQWLSSDVVSSTYTLSPEEPFISIEPGLYNIEQLVILNTNSNNCSIYYTLDGGVPDKSSTLYENAIVIDQNRILKAVTVPDNSNWSNSTITSATYILQPVTPTFSITPDQYTDESFTVNFLCETDNVTYTYTINGESPASGLVGIENSSRFVAVDTILKVVASKEGWSDSEILTGEFYPNSLHLQPENDSSMFVTNMFLDFSGNIDSQKYQIQIFEVEGDSVTNIADFETSQSYYEIPEILGNNKIYYWKYRSYNGISWSIWSDNNYYNFYLDIGDWYQGGIIFYLNEEGGGFIAADADLSDGIQWYNNEYVITGAIGTGIGEGKNNTELIKLIQGDGSYAALLCFDYYIQYKGIIYDDWYLPSRDELNLLFLNKQIIGGFSINNYWSSSEKSLHYVHAQSFSTGNQSFNYPDKDYGYSVRAIRSF